MSISYFADPSMKDHLCLHLIETQCKIPARYRNDTALMMDLRSELDSFDWKYWERILVQLALHDEMVAEEAWENSEEEQWLHDTLAKESGYTDLPGLRNTEIMRTLFRYGSMREFMKRLFRILGGEINANYLRPPQWAIFVEKLGQLYETIIGFEAQVRKGQDKLT